MAAKPLFIRSTKNPTGKYVECRLCHHTGPDTKGKGWQANCLRGHAPCPVCGHLNTVRRDGSARVCTANGAALRHGIVTVTG